MAKLFRSAGGGFKGGWEKKCALGRAATRPRKSEVKQGGVRIAHHRWRIERTASRARLLKLHKLHNCITAIFDVNVVWITTCVTFCGLEDSRGYACIKGVDVAGRSSRPASTSWPACRPQTSGNYSEV